MSLLDAEKRYALNYSKGFRLGKIQSMRAMLIRNIKRLSKEQNITPCKALLQKIQRETDVGFLEKILFLLVYGMAITELEMCYDLCFRTPDEVNAGKYTI